MDIVYSAPGVPVAIRSIAIKGTAVIMQYRVAMLTRYISFSLYALLIWDMLLTLKDEVRSPYLLGRLPEIVLTLL